MLVGAHLCVGMSQFQESSLRKYHLFFTFHFSLILPTLCVSACCMCPAYMKCPQRLEENIRSPGTGDTGSCKSPMQVLGSESVYCKREVFLTSE